MGRASRNEWNIVRDVRPAFFEEADRNRQWNFSFKEYYDILVWDLDAGEPPTHLFNVIQQVYTIIFPQADTLTSLDTNQS